MNSTLHRDIAAEFGAVLADGARALAYRHRNIEPYIDRYGKVILDFSGVRTSNSSFMNALVSGVIEQHGQPVLNKLVFKGCKPTVRVFVESAIELGLQKKSELLAA